MVGKAGSVVASSVAAVLMIVSFGTAYSADIPWKIDKPTALRLVAEGYFGSETDGEYLGYDNRINSEPPFLIVAGSYFQISEGDSPLEAAQHFAVNPWTGDVWDVSICEKLSTPALRKSQATIRSRFTQEETKEYERLSRLAPKSEGDTAPCSDETARRLAASRFADTPWKVEWPVARRLAVEGYFGSDKGQDYLFYNGVDGDPPFFVFDGVNKAPVNGSFGFFAINPWTGDVWNLRGCHKLSTPALRKSQAEIRRRFMRAEMKQFARLSRLKPFCIFEN